MDLNTVTSVMRPRGRDWIGCFAEGDSFMAGGTWLLSEPQRHVRRLIDLSSMGWEPLRADDEGLTLAATCTVAELAGFEAPAEWTAAPLIGLCCRSFLASFKIWNMATVGGNLCMGLPAGPMISLAVALDGVCTIWPAEGGERTIAAADFVRGPLDVVLEPGDILRAIHMPRAALLRRFAFRRASLSTLGRSGVLVSGTLDAAGFILAVTAATRRPVVIAFPGLPEAATLAGRIDAAIAGTLWHDDIHGRPDWRRHMTHEFAAEILAELGGAA